MGRFTRMYQRFFAELKRRKVFHSAAIYGGVAFVVFQAADFMVPALRLSDTVATAIVLVAILGFPIAMWMAWFFNLTQDGLTITDPPKEGELDAIVAQPALKRWPSGLAAAGGIVLLYGGVAWGYWSRLDPVDAFPALTEGSETALVVTPFSNLTGDPGTAYLVEGITREISDGLKRVRSLTVLAGTNLALSSSLPSDGEIGGEMSPSSFLEGSVGNKGGELEVAVRIERLTGEDDGNGGNIWTRSYSISRDGLLLGLDAIAWDIAIQLGADDSERRNGHLIFPWTPNYQAYCDYLLGRHLAHQRTPTAIEGAIEAYHRALILDPEFGAAWSALAVAYLLLTEYGGPPIPEIAPYAQAAVDHALASRGILPEGFAASGFLKWSYSWDFSGAESDLRRSIELDPLNPVSRYWLARALTSRRLWGEAGEQARIALELDPDSPAAHLTLGLFLMCEGQEGAADAFRRALELSPEIHPAAFLLGALLALEGDLAGATAEFDRFAALTGGDPGPLRAYLSALADSQEVPEAVSALRGSAFFGPTQAAALLAHLGQTEAALGQLEEAARSRSTYLLWANALPHFAHLRTEPRFKGVMASAGF